MRKTYFYLIVLALFGLVSATWAQNWGTPVQVNAASTLTKMSADAAPELYSNGIGGMLALWPRPVAIAISRSTDSGATWSAPVQTTWKPKSDVQIKTGSNWVAAWEEGGHICTSRSTDGGANWSAPLQVSNTGMTSVTANSRMSFEQDGMGNMVIAWQAKLYASPMTYPYIVYGDIYFSRSTDNGVTWSAPAYLAPATAGNTLDDAGVVLTAASDGHWVAAWEKYTVDTSYNTHADIGCATSWDGGATWTEGILAGTGSDDRHPVIVHNSGLWIAAWRTGSPVRAAGSTHYHMYRRSTDNGLTWSTPTRLAPTADMVFDNDLVLLPDSTLNWIALWQRKVGPSGDADYYSARTTDGGVTFQAAVPVNSDAASDSFEDKGLQVRWIWSGNFVALWERASADPVEGKLIMEANTSNNGATWASAAAINTNRIAGSGFAAGEDRNVSLAKGPGTAVVAWDSTRPSPLTALGSESYLLFARSLDAGGSWENPAVMVSDMPDSQGNETQPRMAASGSTPGIVWTNTGSPTSRDSDIYFSTASAGVWAPAQPVNTDANIDSFDDQAAELVSESGAWFAVWERWTGTDWDLYFSRNAGTGWSVPAPLNNNAAGDTGADKKVRVAGNGAGVLLATWQSDNGAGTPSEVYFAKSLDNGATWSVRDYIDPEGPIDSFTDSNPAIAYAGNGRWITAWARSERNTTYSMVVRALVSTDGTNWWVSLPQYVATAFQAKTAVHVDVACDAANNAVFLWDGGDAIQYSLSADDGTSFSAQQGINGAWSGHTGRDSDPRVLALGVNHWLVTFINNASVQITFATSALKPKKAYSSEFEGTMWRQPVPVQPMQDSAADVSACYVPAGNQLVAGWCLWDAVAEPLANYNHVYSSSYTFAAASVQDWSLY